MTESPSVNSTETSTQKPPKRLLPGLHRHLFWRTMQFLHQLFFVTWLRLRATGMENLPKDTGAILLINHQSYLDPAIAGVPLKRPICYLARDTLFKVPVIGWIMQNMNVMSINRNAAGTDSLRQSISRLKDGFLVGIFPEGTRTLDGQLAEIKPGFIAIVRRSKLPIIPVGIHGAFRAMPKGSFFIFPTKVSVHYGKPLDPDKVRELTQRGHEKECVGYVREQINLAIEQAARKN